MRLEVRCCCQPTKLLGHIDATEEELYWRTIRRPKLRSCFEPISQELATAVPERFELPIADINVSGEVYAAVKGEHHTTEELKKMQGFVPCANQ